MSAISLQLAGTPTVDAIDLSVIWSTLVSIAEEMGTTLRSTAFSEAVREADDFSTGLFDRHGRLISQGNFTPGHLGSMPYVVQAVEHYYPRGTLEPGDSVILNDSWMGSGHFPDFYMVTPVFVEAQFCGYVVNIAHHVDVGGAAPGSQKVMGVTEAFQEGIRILPVRALRGGKWDEELLRVLLANVRLPDIVRGDLDAQRNANFTGATRFRELIGSYGSAKVEAVVDEILDRSEQRTRELIRAVPEGSYAFEDVLETCIPGDPLVRVAVDVTVADGEVVVDFSRSGDQVAAAINAYINFTRAHGFFAIKVFTGARLPHNEGGLRPIRVIAREGSFFNPRFPAPSGGRAAIQIRIFEVINGALAKALPSRAMAGFSHWSNPIISGTHPRTGGRFIYYDLIFAGYGAREGVDGIEGLAPVLNCANIPVEVHEAYNPVLIRCLEAIPDSGGAGTHRGGCGVRKDIELLVDEATVTLLGDRHMRPPYGLFGGEPGALARTVLNPDGAAEDLLSKQTATLRKGDVLSLRLAGAGGYGSPDERTSSAIEQDIADGYVTPEGARARYGRT
ncbi:N-methylhydantoinase B [Bradyrhizobium sp. F1.4.3]|uniref:hydantoinase B/oxoprolinase family protein n=1 Tax=Bradyrhizobium sp. F1.4.3 TaxID=3156356 RepID=UPI00339518FA